MDRRAIGFFDSGIGGLNVLARAIKQMPEENYIYFGDDLNAPYGDKTDEQVLELTLGAERFMREKNVKAMVIACNTATSAAVLTLRKNLNIPVISMEPAVKPGVKSLTDGKCLVIATKNTISGQRYAKLLEDTDSQRIISIAGEGLVELIEKGEFEDEAIYRRIEELLNEYKDENVQSIVLGCTHYPFVKNAFKAFAEKHFKADIAFFDGIGGTVRQLERVLSERGIKGQSGGKVELFSSGGEKYVQEYEKILKNIAKRGE